MGLNKDFIDRKYGPFQHRITSEEIIKYSEAIGFDSTNSSYSDELIAPPTIPVVYELPVLENIWSDIDLHGTALQRDKNVLNLVHGYQCMKFHKPIHTGQNINFSVTVNQIVDKGTGELLSLNVISLDDKDENVAESDWGLFIRGIGSGKGMKRSKVNKVSSENGEVKMLFQNTIIILEDITFKYSKASNDYNPIHLDDETAKKAGFESIVVHGLCTMSITMNSIIGSYLGSDSSKLAGLSAMFTRPVYPGDTLILEGYKPLIDKQRTSINYKLYRKSDEKEVMKGSFQVVEN